MTERLIRKTNRKIMQFEGYSGVCHNCGTPIETDETFLAIEVDNTPEAYSIVPVDIFVCPECGKYVGGMKVYKTLNITAELSEL